MPRKPYRVAKRLKSGPRQVRVMAAVEEHMLQRGSRWRLHRTADGFHVQQHVPDDDPGGSSRTWVTRQVFADLEAYVAHHDLEVDR